MGVEKIELYWMSWDSPEVEIIDSKIYVPIDQEKIYVLYEQGKEIYRVEQGEKQIGWADMYGHIFLEQKEKMK